MDAYVNTLDLQELRFKHTQGGISSGQPPFDPKALLKLYLYGYLQGIRSSRKLERETYRNLEVIWLIEGILPSYKTIADFRKNNSAALTASNRDFMMLCKELALFGGDQVAVDGSYFKGDASKDSIYTEAKLDKQLEALEKKINDYHQALDEQDNKEDHADKDPLIEDEQLEEKLQLLQKKQAEKKALKTQMLASGAKQISTVDQDARLLTKRGQTIPGYNVQIAVDSKHKLIVANDVVQDGNDAHQLTPMLEKAQEVLASENLEGVADSGYHNGIEIKACEDQGITVYVAVKKPSNKAIELGRFGRQDFQYDAEQDCYLCPQGNQLLPNKNHQKVAEKNMIRYRISSIACNACPLRKQCITDKTKNKQILRWEHQAIVEKHNEQMKQNPQKMRQRGALVEHPFGTLKHRAGINHFLMRGLDKCAGEFSLMVLTYNFTRVMNIRGVDFIRDYCTQKAESKLNNAKYA
ncbi:MAG: IS1182 family transposase [Methylococcaceae bacterium]|nr:IS1182 family transposase [Methylococcaceae bacterium]